MKSTVLASRCAILMATLLAAVAPAAASQNSSSPSKWWTSVEYQRHLDLLPDQSERLEEIFQAAVPKQKVLKKALDQAEAQLERYVEEGDKQAATDQITRVVAARADLHESHSRMLLEMRLVLTRDQWIKLGVLQKAVDRERIENKGK